MKVLIVSADRTASHGQATNLGDSLLTDALATAVAERANDVVVADFGSPRTPSPGSVARHALSGFTDLVRLMRSVDAVLVGGGTLLQNDAPQSAFSGLPRLMLATSVAARVAGRPLAFFAVGCDPVNEALAKTALAAATRGRDVWVRDEASARRFEKYFHRRPHTGADASLLASFSVAESPSTSQEIAFALNRRDGEHLTADLVAGLQQQGFRPTFYSMEQQRPGGDDESVPEVVRSLMEYYPRELSWESLVASMRGVRAVIASRMHALYIALLLGIPAVAVGTSAKVTSFANEFGVPRLERLSDYKPGIEARANAAAVEAARQRVSGALDNALALLKRGE